MYGSVIPGYDSKKGEAKNEAVISGDDPANRDIVRSLLSG
jgi:hypothetical protein